MTVSRRNFLRTTALSALCAGLSFSAFKAFGQNPSGPPEIDPQTGLYRIPQEARTNSTFYFKQLTFEPYVGGVFTIHNDIGSPREMTLVEIKDCRTAAQKASGEPGECFSLLFRHQSDEVIPQGTRDIRHAALGRFELFLVPNKTEQHITYTAVINHMGPAPAPPRP